MIKNIFIKIPTLFATICSVVYLSLTGCGVSSDAFYMAAVGLNKGYILVSNAVVTPASHTVSVYDIDGTFIRVLADKTSSGVIFRGLAMFDAFHVILSTDTPDEMVKLNLQSGKVTTYANSALLTGNIYDTVRQDDGKYLVIESNTIEKFENQLRVPAAGNPYINTTTGACVISAARGLTVNSAGQLLVTSFTNNRILLYDISSSSATCVRSDASFGANQPIPIITHPNGKLYFGTQVNDAIYEAPEDLSTAPTILLSADVNINNPVAMGVLPNGNLIVANDGTDAIIEMTTSGVVVNSNFIKNAFTGTISSILVVPAQ